MNKAQRPLICLVILLLGQASQFGCTFDDQFSDPAWEGKTWIEPEAGEKMNPDRVYGGII